MRGTRQEASLPGLGFTIHPGIRQDKHHSTSDLNLSSGFMTLTHEDSWSLSFPSCKTGRLIPPELFRLEVFNLGGHGCHPGA